MPRLSKKTSKIIVLLCVVAIVLIVTLFLVFKETAQAPVGQDTPPVDITSSVENPQSFDKTKYSIDQPGSIWWIVNKNRPLPDGYVPPDLLVPTVHLRLNPKEEQMQFAGQAEIALNEMFAAAKTNSVELVFGSGYRSPAYQKQLYDSYVAKDGQAAADRYSARPGTSEHQTGLSFDATSVSEKCHLEICFADTPEGKWLKSNSYKYGFIIRYPEGKEAITTYQYEPWHMRYVGVELATELQKTGQTMEEFFGLN